MVSSYSGIPDYNDLTFIVLQIISITLFQCINDIEELYPASRLTINNMS